MLKKFIGLAVVLLPFLLQSCKTTDKIDRLSIEESMIRALHWQEANPIYAKAPTDWTNGAYYVGVTRAHDATKNQVFLTALKEMGVRNNWQTWERFYHADDVVISYSYLHLQNIGEPSVDLKPTEDFIRDHLNKPHEWREGVEDGDQKILWWWCDALFMAPPVLTVYAQLKNDESYLDQMHKYYMETYDLLYDKEEHLFARDIRFKWFGKDSDLKEKNGKKIFWSRGNGWVLGGLALILEDMPASYKHRAFYENLYLEMAAKILEIQPKDGLWNTSLLSPESYDHGEASGTGFFTFALAWGINNGLLPRNEYSSAVKKAWKALEQCQQDSGKVGWVQNIGFDPKPATKDSWQNYGTGAYLLAGSEILKMNNAQAPKSIN